jgi:hypothetical protein
MKKILLTTIVFFCISGVLMAQQKETAKPVAQKNTRIQTSEEHNAKIIALKKANKNRTGNASLPASVTDNGEVVFDKSKFTKQAN